MNYKVTRIGLINFWYFDEEEFEFSDGKILLRGENGSGKSVDFQAFPASPSQSPLSFAYACGESCTRSLAPPLPAKPKGGFTGAPFCG